MSVPVIIKSPDIWMEDPTDASHWMGGKRTKSDGAYAQSASVQAAIGGRFVVRRTPANQTRYLS